MADELGIKLKASLGDYRELIKGISNLEKEIKPIKIKLDLGNARELVNILKKATNLMQGTGSSSTHTSVVQTISSTDISQSINLLTRYSVLLERIKSAKYDGTGFDFGKLKLSELEKSASLLQSALASGETARDELNKFKLDLISAEGAIRQFDVELANMRGDEKFAKDIQNATVQLQNLQNQMLSYLKNTPNLSASTRNAIQSRYDNITQIINSGTATDKNVLDARDFFSAIQRDAKIAGEEVESFGGKIRRLFREHFNTAVAMAGVHLLQTAMRELWQNIQDVDAAMTELKKVTDLSDSNALEFMDKAAVKAKELGANMSGYINSVADWSRLGYKLDDAEMFADASQLYLNVGDDVDDINESTSTLISTVRAFKLEASDAAGVVDKLNEVSNNYATSAGDIGAALARSSAALFAGGNSLEESIALITAAQSTIQDAEKVGTALKTISMYLRSTKTELEAAGESTEGMADSISKLREELLALTHGKVDIQLDEDSYKSTYQILKEMADAWHDMTDMERAAATELMGGKRNSNVISALISDFSIAEESLQTALKSTGSAARENEKYLDSIAGKLSQFEAQFESLSASVVDSGFPKFFIELGTNVLSATEGIINFIDVFPALMGVLSGGLSLTGQKAGKSNMPSYASCDLIAA